MGWSIRFVSGITAALVTIAAVPAPASAATTTTTLVVGFGPGGGRSALAGAGVEVTDVDEAIGVVRVEVPAARAAATRARLTATDAIDFVELDQPVTAAITPTDPYWSYQWGPRTVSAPIAWDVTTGDPSVVVAVLDTGVTSGAEFDGKLLPGIDLVNGDSDPADDNPDGHGTAVAAVAAADANDGGVAGMCWTCRIMPVKVLAADGSGSSYDVARGITWATDRGADVMIMSLGGTGTSQSLAQAVAYARERGVVLVAAAGNAGIDTPTYPAAIPGVIGVAGSTSTDGRYSWSNHGSWVDVAAPGCNGAPRPSGGYGDFCGTSSATPLTAGVVALGLAMGASGPVVEEALRSTAVPVGSWVERGRIDAAATVQAVRTALSTSGTTGGTAPTAPTAPDGEAAPAPDEPVEEPPAGTTVDRVAGDDRIATSVALADRAFPDGAGHVVIGRADAYADALAAAPLAASLDAPVVLSASGGVRDDVVSLVRRLGADHAVLVGGTGALAPAVAEELRGIGVAVRRIAGANRFDTARLVAAELGPGGAYLVEGANASAARGWPDAVAVSGLAALQRRPILLTAAGSLPAETAAALRSLGGGAVTVVGGTAAVSGSVADEVASFGPVRRISGVTRYDTSTKLAELATASGIDADAAWLATGRSFPDALAAGAAAARRGALLLLVDGIDPDASPEPLAWLRSRPSLREVVLVGGTSTVTGAVETALGAPG